MDEVNIFLDSVPIPRLRLLEALQRIGVHDLKGLQDLSQGDLDKSGKLLV